MKRFLLPLVASVAVLTSAGCSGDAQAMTPQHIEDQYGVSGAYTDTVKTADGNLSGTLVPVTLADGRAAHPVHSGQGGEGAARRLPPRRRGVASGERQTERHAR